MAPPAKPPRHASPITTVRSWRYATAIASEDAMPLSKDCEAPVYREVRGAQSGVLSRLAQWRDNPALDHAPGYGLIGGFQQPTTDTANIKVRCRKCPACLRFRQRQWTAKAVLETRVSTRSWFVTLTFAPMQRFQAEAKARKIVRTRRNEGFEQLTPHERFRAIERETSIEVTKWLKRLRKNAGRFRYILVSEFHKDGFPHYHLLIHEIGASPIKKRDIQATWHAGFSNAKLVDTYDGKATRYVCKYLSKSASTRVRASQKYGDVGALSEAVRKAVDALPRYVFPTRNTEPACLIVHDEVCLVTPIELGETPNESEEFRERLGDIIMKQSGESGDSNA